MNHRRATILFMLIALLLLTACQGRRQRQQEATGGPDEGVVISGTNEQSQSAVTEFTLIRQVGGRVSWSHERNLIAYDQAGEDGKFDIYVMAPDGSGDRCLTCDSSVLPNLNNGQPEWHPSGDYLVLQVESPDLEQYPNLPGGIDNTITGPGVGFNNNLWLMSADGSRAWQLTDINDKFGVLHPHFSPDGTKLLWGETTTRRPERIGNWSIKIADFSFDGDTPRLSNVQQMTPLDLQLYETHGFSPDGGTILFSGIERGEYYYDMEIYKMDLASGETTKLTDNDEWDEHAHFTMDGRHIVWTSSMGIDQEKGTTRPGLDYWIMEPDGSNKRRLTYFNDPSALEYVPGKIGAADFDWSPDGRQIAAYLIRGRGDAEATNSTAIVTLDLP